MSSIELSRPADASIAPEVLVNLVSMPQALQTISQRALARQGFTLFTVNLDHIVKLGDAGAFRDAYARADFVSADGWPIVWVMKRAGYDVERTAGADLLEPVCRLARCISSAPVRRRRRPGSKFWASAIPACGSSGGKRRK